MEENRCIKLSVIHPDLAKDIEVDSQSFRRFLEVYGVESMLKSLFKLPKPAENHRLVFDVSLSLMTDEEIDAENAKIEESK